MPALGGAWSIDAQLAPFWPRQHAVANVAPRTIGKDRLTLHHAFDVTALVLARKDYVSGRETRVSPLDLALGWGPMSNPEVVSGLEIRQAGRFYRWHYDRSVGLKPDEIARYSANMHMIPSGSGVASALGGIAPGSVVRISGFLVDVTGPDGARWISSTSRNDTGAGACEIVLVEHVSVFDGRPSIEPVASPFPLPSPGPVRRP